MFLLSCVHVRNWESTNFNLIPRGFSATFRLRAKARIFSSFQLLSIVLTYKVNSLFHFSQPVLAQSSSGNIENETERERERQDVLWPDTHPKIATVNIHTKKVALSESAKVDQISSLAFPHFRYRSYHTVGECVGFWEKNAYLNLVRARMERLTSALRKGEFGNERIHA